jgi:hypothetical protein
MLFRFYGALLQRHDEQGWQGLLVHLLYHRPVLDSIFGGQFAKDNHYAGFAWSFSAHFIKAAFPAGDV